MQSRYSFFQKYRITVKQSDKKSRCNLYNAPHKQCIGKTYDRYKLDCLFYLSKSFFTIVKTHHRRRTICQTMHHHRRNITHGIQYCHDTYINISTIYMQCRITENLHQTIGKLHHKTRNTKRHDIFYTFPFKSHGRPVQLKRHSLSCQKS